MNKMIKAELSVKRQNYGNKWYLKPQKWNESMNRTKDKKRYEFISNEKYVDFDLYIFYFICLKSSK